MKSISPLLIAAALAGSASSQAAIVASGIRDLVITNTFQGIYLDVDAGSVVAEEATGWDINPFFGGEGLANSPSFEPVRATVAVSSAIVNLAAGQTVDGTSTFATGYAGSGTHVGNGLSQFVSGGEGYIGFKLVTDANEGPYFGWMRVSFSNDGSTGMIHEWAYENSGSAITIGAGAAAVPEPSVVCSVLLGVAGFCFRRRK
ncbi:MAG: PEP-CTERM sorting domain-containing protein [Luteolibacter sp.]